MHGKGTFFPVQWNSYHVVYTGCQIEKCNEEKLHELLLLLQLYVAKKVQIVNDNSVNIPMQRYAVKYST